MISRRLTKRCQYILCLLPLPSELNDLVLPCLSSVYRATIKQHKNVTNMALEKRSIAACIEALNPLIYSDTVLPSKGAR